MADLNVQFLKGSLESLEKMTTSVAGAFYLTEDVPRLYYGTGSGAPIPVNEQITVVDSIASLPSPARAKDLLYYAKQENILCISKTDKSGWIQINPDTDTNTSIHEFTVSEAKPDNDDWVYELKIVEKDKDGNLTDKNGNAIGEFTAELRITPDMIADLAVTVSVGVGATVADNAMTLALNGIGANAGETVVISGGDNVIIEGTADAPVISAVDTNYTFDFEAGTDAATVYLFEDVNGSRVEDGGAFTIKGGEKTDVVLSGSEITINHEKSTVEAKAYEAAKSGTINEQVITIPEFTVDTYGHVTAAGTKDITVSNKTYTMHEVSANNAGDLTVAIKDENGNASSLTAEKALYYTITVDGKETDPIYNQGNLGSFYSKDTIDGMMKGLDAFTYKGTVGTGGTVATLPTTGVSIGDTYKATEDGTYKINKRDVDLHAGDIIIANGTEEEDGKILSENLHWDVIHSENNTDTTYTLSAATNQITLTDSNNTPNHIDVEGDGVVTLTTAGNKLTAGHATSGVIANTYGGNGGEVGYGETISIPQITVDANGHVTAAATKDYVLPAENVYTFEADETDNALYLCDSDGRVGSLAIEEDDWIDANLEKVTTKPAGGKLTVSHKDVERKDSSASVEKGYGETFTAITSMVSDDKGHITDVTTTTYTLPLETIYSLSGALADVTGGVSVTDTLLGKDNAQTTSSFNLISDSLKITQDGTNIKTELVWGSF